MRCLGHLNAPLGPSTELYLTLDARQEATQDQARLASPLASPTDMSRVWTGPTRGTQSSIQIQGTFNYARHL